MPVDFFQVVYAGPETWCQVQGLHPASFYEFWLFAVSLLGTSVPGPTAIFSTPGAPPGPPPPPFLLGIEGGDIHVGWTLPDVCNGSPVTSFVLEVLVQDKADINPIWQTAGWVTSVQYQGSRIAHWIKNLRPGIVVWLRVACVNAHGQGCFSTPANVVTPEPKSVQIFVKPPSGPGFAVNVNLQQTILSLKEQIREMLGVPIDSQRIVYAGKQAEDTQKLLNLHITKDCTIFMSYFLRGGGDGKDAPASIGEIPRDKGGKFTSAKGHLPRDRDASTDPRGDRVGVDDGADHHSHNDGSVDANSDAAVPSLLVLLGFLFVIFLRMHI